MIFALPSREARKAWVARVALGSAPLCLPKKLSWSAVASDVCESVEPIMPNLNGFDPSSCSRRLRPIARDCPRKVAASLIGRISEKQRQEWVGGKPARRSVSTTFCRRRADLVLADALNHLV